LVLNRHRGKGNLRFFCFMNLRHLSALDTRHCIQGVFMQYDFDTPPERRGSDSAKWKKYGDDVLPLWVADMDFVSAEPILRALHSRVDHGCFGYATPSGEFCETILNRLKALYGWEVRDEAIHHLPGLVTGLNFAIQAFTGLGEGVMVAPGLPSLCERPGPPRASPR
jgi:cystathionine beta-lyase